MPIYAYRCLTCNYRGEKFQTYENLAPVLCGCGAVMNRLPSRIIGVNWNGLKPSQGEMDPPLKRFLDDTPARRAAFEVRHEAHERRTADE